MPSSAVALRSDKPLTPAMVSAIWELASALDAARIPAEVDNSVWLEVPSRLLRGEDGRNDNVWLRECLMLPMKIIERVIIKVNFNRHSLSLRIRLFRPPGAADPKRNPHTTANTLAAFRLATPPQQLPFLSIDTFFVDFIL